MTLSTLGERLNASRDILMSKARKMTILTITMFNENVHTGCLFLNGKKSRHSLNGWGGVGWGWGSSCQVPLLTDRWFGESDLPSSNKGYTGYREGIGWYRGS